MFMAEEGNCTNDCSTFQEFVPFAGWPHVDFANARFRPAASGVALSRPCPAIPPGRCTDRHSRRGRSSVPFASIGVLPHKVDARQLAVTFRSAAISSHHVPVAARSAFSSFSLSFFMPAPARFFITRLASGSNVSLKSHPLFRLNILQVTLHASALPREKTISILGISGGSFPSVAKNAFCRSSRTTILTFLFPRNGTETVSRYSLPTSPCEPLFADSIASTPGNQSPKRSKFVT